MPNLLLATESDTFIYQLIHFMYDILNEYW